VKKYLLAVVVIALVLLLVVAGITPLGAPRPLPAGAPAALFSAGRAMDLLRRVAASPRPVGSPQSRRVRALVLERLGALQLSPHVQVAAVVSPLDPRVAATVHNVVARLPGRSSTRAVLLVAHLDSVPVSDGAGDNGAGVVTLLEVARALRAGPAPRDDVIFLFTDAEENGLLGVRAFLRDDPWAYAAGVVLNVDDPGSSTPALMYETSPGNGFLVRQFFAAAPHPYGSSLMYEVARRQPIITDFRRFLGAGMAGMSFGALDGPGAMDTGYDTVAAYHPASLQHQGETVLATTRRLASLDLWDLHRADVVYFDAVGSVGVVYGRGWVPVFAALAVAVFVAAAVVAARRRLLTADGLAASLVATIAMLGVAMALLALIWSMYRSAYEQRVWTQTGVVVSDLYRLGLVLLAAAAVVACYGVALRRLRPWDLAVAALVWWAVACVVVSLTVPGASYLVTWPLMAAGLGLAAAALLGDEGHASFAGIAVSVAGAAPGLVLLSSSTYLLLLSAGLKQVVTVLAVWLACGLLVLPLAVVWRALRFWLPAALVVVGAVVLFSVGSAVAFDAEHPKFTSVFYRQGVRSAEWQIVDRVDAWTQQFMLPLAVAQFSPSYFPQIGSRTTFAAAAPDARLTPVRIAVLSDVVTGDRRTVKLRLTSPRGAQEISLLVHSVVGTLTAAVQGQTLGGADTTILDGTTVRWAFDYYAPPPGGIDVTLAFQAGPSVLLSAEDFSYGIPAALAGRYAPRPAGMLAGRIGDGALTQTAVRLPAVKAGSGTAVVQPAP
jgi:hypothetical protein